MKILLYPKSDNPYQSLLFTERAFAEDDFEYLNYFFSNIDSINRILIFFSITKFRLSGYSVFHLHWLYNFSSRNPSYIFLLFNSIYIPFFLIYIRLLGFKLIWTAHNLTPHEKTTLNDEFLTRIICKLSEKIIFHTDEAAITLNKSNSILDKTAIIPMGNYKKLFIPSKSSQETRKILSIPKSSFVFLFFGQIKPYKGVNDLLKAFSVLQRSFSNCHLLIVGNFTDDSYKRKILKEVEKCPNVITKFNIVSDDELSNYIKASNVAIFPFLRLTTSSSVIHALSGNKPVIAPKIGSIKEIPSDTGYYYHPNTMNELERCMAHAIKDLSLNNNIQQAINRYVSELSWSQAAEKTRAVYTDPD